MTNGSMAAQLKSHEEIQCPANSPPTGECRKVAMQVATPVVMPDWITP